MGETGGRRTHQMPLSVKTGYKRAITRAATVCSESRAMYEMMDYMNDISW